jgi:hypothetical protein
MSEVYSSCVDQLLINLARHFKYIKDGAQIPGSWNYQVRKLAEMDAVTRESEQIILSVLGDADESLRGVLEEAIRNGLADAEPALRKAAEKGLTNGVTVPNIAPRQMQAFRYYYEQSADKLNLVNTVMLESTQQAYAATVADIATRISNTQGILNTATGQIITGVDSFNKVQRQAVQRMVKNGITGYIDHGGHHWSPEAYVAMDMRTTMTNTARQAVWEQSDAVGCDLYQVSWHDGARPLCYPWQGKIISRNGMTGEVTDGDGNTVQVHSESEIESFKYGGGLFGVNCGHYPIPFFPGFSRSRPPQQNEEENAREYAESQQQRALERNVRDEKRELEVMKAQGATQEELDAQKIRVRNANAQLTEFCDKTGRARQPGRTATPINATFPDKYQQTRYGTKNPPNMPVTLPPVTPAFVPQNVAQQATQAQPPVATVKKAQLDAKNFPDVFNAKKTKTFVEAVNATEGTNADVVELFNRMGEQVSGATYPVTISYTAAGHAVQTWVRSFGGPPVRLNVKVPKLIDPEFVRQEIGTTAHELGHLFDQLNTDPGRIGPISSYNDGSALPKALRNARPMSERVKTLIADAVREGKAAEQLALDTAKSEIDAITAEISKALNEKNYSEYNRLAKQRNALWKNASKAASKASRKAHNGRNAIEDIYDAISGGTLRDRTPGMYGHGSTYYGHDPGGESAAAETIANYCSLALAYPDLFQLMAEEQPEIWEACGNIIKAMLGR